MILKWHPLIKNEQAYEISYSQAKGTKSTSFLMRTPPPHSTGRRSGYAHGDLGFSLKLFQITVEA